MARHRSLMRKVFTLRTLTSVAFLVAVLAAMGGTLLRESLAAQSPVARSRMILAATIASAKEPRQLESAARALALRDPLQAAAFVMVGLGQAQDKAIPFDRIHPLMVAAMDRQPTLEIPQIMLAADYARRGDFDRSLDMLDKVLTLSGDFTDRLMPALADLLRNPRGREAVLAKLHQYPVWRTALLTRAITSKVISDDLVVALLADPVPAAHRASVGLERMQWVRALVDRGEVERAHAFYRSYVGIDPRAPLYDGDFAIEQPFKPFGWTVAGLAEDYGERVARQGGGWAMRLHASGERPVTLLEQTLALAQGRWNAELTGRDAGLGAPTGNRLVLQCLGTKDPLAAVSLGNLRGQDSTLRLGFTVPAGCPLQRLAVLAGDTDGKASEIELTSFKVTAQ